MQYEVNSQIGKDVQIKHILKSLSILNLFLIPRTIGIAFFFFLT